MPHTALWAAALSLLLQHGETGCARTALLASGLLDRIADSPDVDSATRSLCEQASLRLATAAGN